MTKKEMFGLGAVGMLALAGCQHGMYAYEVSVYRNKNGISDYTVVDSLDVAEYPQSMPVVVKLTSMSQGTGGYDWRAAVSVLTLYTLPRIITSEMRQYDVTVKTPLGEKSGSYRVAVYSWIGWMPIFFPSFGNVAERTPNPQLPNADIECRVRDKLVANLVSQFSKKEYAEFAAKNNSTELKAQRAKTETER